MRKRDRIIRVLIVRSNQHRNLYSLYKFIHCDGNNINNQIWLYKCTNHKSAIWSEKTQWVETLAHRSDNPNSTPWTVRQLSPDSCPLTSEVHSKFEIMCAIVCTHTHTCIQSTITFLKGLQDKQW